MQRQTVGEARWSAIRELREGEAPVYSRLSLATGVNASTIRERASRDRWAKQPFQSKIEREAHAGRGRPGAEAQAEAGEGIVPEGWHDMSAAERLQWLNDFAVNKVAEIAMSAEAGGGVPNKGKLDAVWSMIRMVERSETLAQERAADNETVDDAELAARLRKLDERIVELAEAHAEWLVAGGDRQRLG